MTTALVKQNDGAGPVGQASKVAGGSFIHGSPTSIGNTLFELANTHPSFAAYGPTPASSTPSADRTPGSKPF